jgi:ATP-dependent Clp protease ATP-binding subunit ClpC
MSGREEQSRQKAVATAAREAARSIAERLGEYPDPDELAEDEAFARAAQALAEPGVSFETCARLARAQTPVTAAIALRGIALRDGVPDWWLRWAFRRLTPAPPLELRFLLETIERHAEPPLLAGVLARADDDWHEEPMLPLVAAFVERRVASGEAPTPADLEGRFEREHEPRLTALFGELGPLLPRSTLDAFEEWRRGGVDVDFFKGLGRVWEPGAEPPALTSVAGRAAALALVEATLGGPSPRSLLLVGEHGVGKSAVLREVLRRLHAHGWFVFAAGAAEVMAGQVYIGELEGRVRDIAARMDGRRALWILPAFEEALWAGQHSRSPQGLLDAMLPLVEARKLLVVGELEPSAYELLVQQRPRVTSAFETVRLPALTGDEEVAVARDWAAREGVDADAATVEEARDLAQHYLAGAAAPGRLLKLLKATLARAARSGSVALDTHAVLETLSEATGLPLHVVDPHAPLDLEEVRRTFAARVLAQDEAVDCLVERIALIKAGLSAPSRPLGVFLFVGPTGTGKTELAKALADFLFGSEDRLVRLDMSEFKTPDSYERLLGDTTGAGEAARLISSVRAQPFSVVLLDEFEKAHPNVWDLFLQLFDDGRLTDRNGRTADFRQCVVILTSNLGAAVERGTRLGFGSDGEPRFRAAAVEREVAKVFRPEFLNRLDRVVVFHPLERTHMRQLLEKELAGVLERRGFRMHPWAVEWDEAALEFLIEKGFSAELGARPLKRAVERYLLAPLARAIVARRFPEGDQFLFITARGDRIEVSFVDPDAEEPEAPPTPPPAPLRLEALVGGARGREDEKAFLASETERLRGVIRGRAWDELVESDLAATREQGFWESPERFAVLGRIEYVERVRAAFAVAEKLHARLAAPGRNGRAPARRVVELLAERLYLLDRACAGVSVGDANDAFLSVWPSASAPAAEEFAQALTEMYEAWARRRGMRLRRLGPGAGPGRVLAVTGIAAFTILAPEAGLHVLELPHGERTFDRVGVHVDVAPWPSGPPDDDVEEIARAALASRKGDDPPTVVRRYRSEPSPLVRDSVRDWRTGRLDRVLGGDFDVIAER